MRTTVLMLGLCLLSCLPTFAQPEQPVQPPRVADLGSGDIAIRKTDVISERLTRINQIAEKLEKFGDPAKKSPDETTEEYLKRVDRIFKARALFIIELHQEMQTVLEAKAQLDLYVDKYKRFVKRAEEFLGKRPSQLRQEVVDLQKKGDEALKDAAVLREMILTEGKDNAELVAQMNGKPYSDLPKSSEVSDASERMQKYTSLNLALKQDKLSELIGVVVDSAFEVNLLNNTFIPESEDLKAILPSEHTKALAAIESTLAKNKGQMAMLEDKAAQLSILAKRHGENLSLVRPSSIEGKEPLQRLLEIGKMEAALAPSMDKFLRATKAQTLSVEGGGGLSSAIKTLQLKPAESPKDK